MVILTILSNTEGGPSVVEATAGAAAADMDRWAARADRRLVAVGAVVRANRTRANIVQSIYKCKAKGDGSLVG